MSQEIGQEFITKTRYLSSDQPDSLTVSDQKKGLPQPPIELDYTEQTLVDLPKPNDIPAYAIDLKTAVDSRQSVRKYAPQPLTLEELSFLLWCTQGVKKVIEPRQHTLRTVPSAGARHAFETYLLVNDVQGLHPGLYRFVATEHKLVESNLETGLADKITLAFWSGNQTQVKKSAVTFLWTAVACRMTWRYGVRGYRYLFVDAGHVCQNLYLAAEAIGAGVCAIATFIDDELNDLLGIDGKEEFAIYLATVGKKQVLLDKETADELAED